MRTRFLSITRTRTQKRRVIQKLLAFAAASALASIIALPSFASGRWYLDIGGGAGIAANPAPLLPGSTAGLTSIGAGSLMHDFQTHGALFSFQLGLAERWLNLGSYSFITSNILGRFEFGPVFVGAGVSPYIIGEGGKVGSSYTHVTGYSVLGEAGYDWKIIPTFSITVSGALEMVRAGQSIGPISIEGTACFRFYFGTKYDPTRQREYEGGGWRYPKGIEKN